MESILQQVSKVKRKQLGDKIPILIFRVLRHYTHGYASDLLGEKASNILFVNSGKALGLELGKTLHDTNLQSYLKKISSFVEKERIGILNVVELFDEKLVVQLDECITCAGMDNIDKRICFF